MKKEDMIKGIIVMAEEIKPLLEESSVKPTYLDLEDDFTNLLRPMIEEGYKWLKKIYEHEYETLRKTNTLLTPEMWKRYESWGILDASQEVKKRTKHRMALRQSLITRQRPDFWKKVKRNDAIRERSKTTEK